jgi:hypothetical protein
VVVKCSKIVVLVCLASKGRRSSVRCLCTQESLGSDCYMVPYIGVNHAGGDIHTKTMDVLFETDEEIRAGLRDVRRY